MKKSTILGLLILINTLVSAQDCPYKVKPWVDIPITAVLGGTSLLGLSNINKKPGLDSSYIASLKPEDVNRFDRISINGSKRSSSINMCSDIAMYSAILAGPTFLLSYNKTRKHFWTVGLIYLQTMMVMSNFYLWTNGTIDRNRPYLYNPNIPIEDKMGSHSRNSFIAGHPAAAAASTFFIAKVFHDYNPDSKWKKFVWAGAVIPPAIVTYCRYKNGEHFPTDILVGVPLGAAIGIIVPHLHLQNRKNQNLSFYPAPGGLGLTGRF
jgi:membrane-associated phospholipid phosphatase